MKAIGVFVLGARGDFYQNAQIGGRFYRIANCAYYTLEAVTSDGTHVLFKETQSERFNNVLRIQKSTLIHEFLPCDTKI